MNPVLFSVFGISFIFLCTTLGASFVFFFKREISGRLNDVIVGFAGGIMLAASCFSLIGPVLEMDDLVLPGYAVGAIGTLLGVLFLYLIDRLLPHFHIAEKKNEGLGASKVNKTLKMFFAVTIHNIPEGLSVGVAFGVALSLYASSSDMSFVFSALSLALGIGIQNIPEGLSVALPFKAETDKRGKAFLYGTLSGAVEPIAALFGLFLAMQVQSIMPWALSFAGGAMLYVILEEMVPETSKDSTSHLGVFSFIFGFVLMMVMDRAL